MPGDRLSVLPKTRSATRFPAVPIRDWPRAVAVIETLPYVYPAEFEDVGRDIVALTDDTVIAMECDPDDIRLRVPPLLL